MGEAVLDSSDKFRMAQLCLGRLSECGLEVEQVLDPEEARLRMAVLDKPRPRPASDILESDLTTQNSFSLFYKSEGYDIGCVSVRIDHIRGERFEDFWARLIRRAYTDSEEFPLDTTHRLPLNLTGRLVYIGDMFISPSYRGAANLHLRAAIWASYIYAIDKWPDLDAIYAMFTEKVVQDGYLATYNASEMVISPQAGLKDVAGRVDTDYLAVIWPKYIAYYARYFTNSPDIFDSYRSVVSGKAVSRGN